MNKQLCYLILIWFTFVGLGDMFYLSPLLSIRRYSSKDFFRARSVDSLKSEISNIENEINFTNREIETARKTLIELRNEYGDDIDRIKKEFSNIRDRAMNDVAIQNLKAIEIAVTPIFDICDNIARALNFVNNSSPSGSVAKILGGMQSSITKILTDYNVSIVETVGRPFDFNTMDAIQYIPSNDFPLDVVAREYKLGFQMGDKCIRPAVVVVSSGPS